MCLKGECKVICERCKDYDGRGEREGRQGKVSGEELSGCRR